MKEYANKYLLVRKKSDQSEVCRIDVSDLSKKDREVRWDELDAAYAKSEYTSCFQTSETPLRVFGEEVKTELKVPGLCNFRLCNLSDSELSARVMHRLNAMYKTGVVPSRHIPARPHSDFDLLVGEMAVRLIAKSELPQDKPIDFEALGFTSKYNGVGDGSKCYTKSHKKDVLPSECMCVDILHTEGNGWTLIAIGDNESPYSNWATYFMGYIKNHREMEMILRMTNLI